MASKLVLDGKWKEDQFSHVGIAVWIHFHTIKKTDVYLEAHALAIVNLDVKSKDLLEAGGSISWQAVRLPLKEQCSRSCIEELDKSLPSIWQFLIAGSKVSKWLRKKTGRGVDTIKKFHVQS